MNIEDIRKLCGEEKLRWTYHIMTRLIQRNISIKDVAYAIMNGEIIEEYPDDYPYPSCLILGFKLNKDYLHVVCGINGNIELYLITAYHPDLEEWTEDFKHRRQNGKEQI